MKDKSRDQSLILSFALEQTVKKFSLWFPKNDIQIWDGKVKNAVYLWVSALENAQGHNPMEILRIRKDDAKGEYEIQVPCPRMMDLHFAVIPALSNCEDALNFSSRLVRNLNDDPFVSLDEFNWYGNGDGRTMLEEVPPDRTLPLPELLSAFSPYRRSLKMTLGINSAREEKITRVQKRQFTAVKK